MNTAIKKRIRKTKYTNVRDRLRLVGDVQECGNITEAVKKLGMSQLWGSKWRTRYKVEGFDVNWHVDGAWSGNVGTKNPCCGVET